MQVRVETIHLYHYYPGHTIHFHKPECCSVCKDCWLKGSLIDNESYQNKKGGDKKLPFERQVLGVATVYSGEQKTNVLKVFKKAREKNLKTILITPGFLTEEQIQRLLPLTDAVVLHLKGASKAIYAKLTGKIHGFELALTNMKKILKRNKHLEISFTVIPGVNSTENAIKKLIGKIQMMRENIPFHLLRFLSSRYLIGKMPTRDRLMKNLWLTASKELDFVYQDCLFQGKHKNSFYPQTGYNKLGIKRVGDTVIPINIDRKEELNIIGEIKENNTYNLI